MSNDKSKPIENQVNELFTQKIEPNQEFIQKLAKSGDPDAQALVLALLIFKATCKEPDAAKAALITLKQLVDKVIPANATQTAPPLVQ